MNTTDLFVEQVLIGFLVLIMAALTAYSSLADLLPSGEDWAVKLIIGAAAAGAAYLIGILYDRITDTLLEDIEQHNRLRFALRGLRELPEYDPYPESRLRAQLYLAGEPVNQHAGYIRTRMRLTRSLATAIPGAAFAFELGYLQSRGLPHTIWLLGVLWLVASYLVALALQVWLKSPARQRTHRGWPYKPPKTDQTEALDRYRALAGIPEPTEQAKSIWWFAVQEPAVLAAVALLGVGVAFASWGSGGYLFLVPLAALPLALLVGWCWWRITITFFALLREVGAMSSAGE